MRILSTMPIIIIAAAVFATAAQPETGEAASSLQALGSDEVIAVLGEKVRGPTDEDMGVIVNVLVDSEGRPRAAVIDFGGFLGVGSRKVAVDWRLLRFKPADPKLPVLLSLDRAEVQAAPEYKPGGKSVQMVAPSATPEEAAPSLGRQN